MALSSIQRQKDANLFMGVSNSPPFHGHLKKIVFNDAPCWRKQRSSVIDRWVGSQASQIFKVSEERKYKDAEISVIFDGVEPVSSRTAAFVNQDTSPKSGSPVSWTLSDRSVFDDLPSSARASSLIQLWREIEADKENSVSSRRRNDNSENGSLKSSDLGSDLVLRKELVEDDESEFSGFLERMKREQQEELDLLLQERCVSGFSSQGWIQALLRFRHSDRLYLIAKKQIQSSNETELDDSRQQISNACSLRREFLPLNGKLVNSIPVMPRSASDVPPRLVHSRDNDSKLNVEYIQSPVSLCSHKSFPETKDIQELLQRKPVSCSLSGEFRKRMDKLVLSLFQKQKSTYKVMYDDDELPSAAGSSSASSFDSPKAYEESCISSRPLHRFIEMGAVDDLRKDIAEIHHEIDDLRKLLNRCVEGHSKLQDLIKGQLSSAAFGSEFKIPKRALAKEAPCILCHETLIDSLLYRCGHLCACYSCAVDLRLKNEVCPICTSPIDDVIKVLSETKTV